MKWNGWKIYFDHLPTHIYEFSGKLPGYNAGW